MTDLLVERTASVTRLTLNRSHVRNAINSALHHDLQNALDIFSQDASQRICIITGAGEKAFCAGSDLKEWSDAEAEGRLDDLAYPASGYAGLTQRFDLDKPVIAAVNGDALGGGLEIVLACDIVIATESARFGLPEPLVGAVALAGGLHRLARQIGLKPAMGLILTGKSIMAAEALRLGLINDVVTRDKMEERTGLWVEAILRTAPSATAASKQTVMRGLDEPTLEVAIARQEAYPAFKAWRSSGDGLEGASAFTNKRPPRWLLEQSS